MRAAAWALLVASLLAAVPPAEAKQAFRTFGEQDVPPEGYAVHGDVLVAFHFSQGAWRLRSHELRTDVERELATVPGAGTKVSGLAFDGTWAAWSDDRTGDREVYALEVATGFVVRVTSTPADDADPDVAGGELLWIRNRALYTTSLPDVDERRVVTSGPVAEPVFAGQAIVWVRVPTASTENRTLVATVDGAETVLHQAPGAFPGNPRGNQHLIAWTTPSLRVPGEPGYGVGGTVVQITNGTGGPVTNLTDRFAPAGGMSLAEDRVCWMEDDVARCYRWSDATWTEVRVQADALALSATQTIAYQSGPGGFGRVLVLGGASKGAPLPLAVPLGGLMLAAFALRRWA